MLEEPYYLRYMWLMKGGMKENMDYITCERRKNSPMINVLICEKKCEHAKICKPYLNYLKAQSSKASTSESAPAEGDPLPIKSSNPKKAPFLIVGK